MIVLVLGGARSGKSAAAEAISGQLRQPVTYLATVEHDGADADLTARVAAHQARRPASWKTEQADPVLAEHVARLSGTVLLDSLGPWVALNRPSSAALEALGRAIANRGGDTVVVSDEVGMSVHPSTAAGRDFRDRLGSANAAVASVADHVLLVVAGRVLRTDPLDVAALTGHAP